MHIFGKKYEEVIGIRIRHRLYSLYYGDAQPKPDDVIYVDPSNINFVNNPPFRNNSFICRSGSYVRGMKWDQRPVSFEKWYQLDYENPSTMLFENCKLYESMKDHFINDIDWEKTDWYKWVLEHPHGQYKTPSAAQNQFVKLDEMYEEICETGYKSQREINSTKMQYRHKFPEYDEVRINIGRDGTLFFDEGRHRLSIAKLLEINEIPVRVLVRHKDWQRKRHERTKEFQDHPDFEILPE